MTFAENEKLECLIKLTYIDDDMSDVKAFKAMDVSDVVLSDKLNKRVDKLINKSNHNKRIMIKKSTVRLLVAAVIMATLIIASILSISAVRDAIRNAIVDFFEEYVSVHFIPQSDNAESTSDELPSADATSVETLSNLNSIQEYKRPKLPEEYNMVELMKTSGMYCFEIYLNDVDSVNADDLYSVTIDNGDGTQTVNIFQQPIKYIDEDGSIKFRTNSLERISSNSIFSTKNSTYTYKNEEGEVKTYYSDKIENGVSIVYNDYAIAIQPLTDSSKYPDISTLMGIEAVGEAVDTSKAVSIVPTQDDVKTQDVTFSCDNSKIMYHNVLTNGITYEYMPIPNGIKENIILSKYSGFNAFRFVMNFGELVPEVLAVRGDSIRLYDPNDPDAEGMIISPTYAYDAVGRFSYDHAMYLTETDVEGQYILTLVVDREFLESADTVYPVTIDPTVYPEHTDGVADTFISSNHPTINYSHAVFMPIGNDVNYAQSEAFVQLQNIENYSIDPQSITEAKLVLNCYFTTGNENNPVLIYGYSNNSNVDISNVTWANRPSNVSGTPYGSIAGNPLSIQGTNLVQMHITELVRDWFLFKSNDGGQSYLNSIRLRMENDTTETHYATFRTTEWNNGNYPYFSITYMNTAPNLISGKYYYLKNKMTGQYLSIQDNVSTDEDIVQKFDSGDDGQKWKIVLIGENEYKLVSKLHSGKALCAATGDDVIFNTYVSNSNGDFIIERNTDGYSYRIIAANMQGDMAISVNGENYSENTEIVLIAYVDGQELSEWIFEPVDYFSKELLLQYALNNDDDIPENVPGMYPWLNQKDSNILTPNRYDDADCANFVSQCLLAGGVNFEGRWWIYKLNDDNPYPTLSDHFNNSWKVDDSDDNNPWISAKGFDEYWRDRVAHQDFTTGQLLADDKPEGLYNFEVGDVIMVMENGIGTHAMIITRAPEDYRNEDEVLYLSGHTNFRMDESFRDILEDMNTNTVFRFYNFHDIKG